ncbi:MAG: hypothetical protein AVDCRST_MAG93-6691, partial [uncultured Chloroflexia bacterium]
CQRTMDLFGNQPKWQYHGNRPSVRQKLV